MNSFKAIVFSILVVVGFIILGFGLTALDLGMFKFWAPRYENVKREVFEQTKSYNEGKTQDLAKYKLEYALAKDAESKQAIKMVVVQRFADYQADRLEPGLANFLIQMRGY